MLRTIPPGQGSGNGALGSVIAAAITLAIGLVAILFLLVPTRPGVEGTGLSPGIAMTAAFVLLTPVLGALLAIRRPDNRIGWLFIAVAFSFVVSFAGDGIARHAPSGSTVGLVVVLCSAVGYFAFGVLFVIFQTFPTGQVLPGWGWLPAAIIAGSAAQAVTILLGPLTLNPPVPDLANPLARADWQPALDLLSTASGLLLVVATVGTLVALVLRVRRARGVERQQIKFFLWAAMLTVALLAASLVSAPWGPVSDALWSLALASLVLLPIATTAAILRYRLWDIDRIISRTLGYASVTGLLAIVFAGLVLLMQQLLAQVTGAGTLSIAVSTLAVFALFHPARARIQRWVDRRFDRAHYDAEVALVLVADRLRGLTDPRSVHDEIELAIRAALAPSMVTVWVRER